MSPEQIAALGGDLANLSAAAIGAISAGQAATITADQFDGFDASDIAALSAAAVAGLMPTVLASLSDDQLAALTPAQLAQVTAAQIDSLTPAQITALGADVAALSAEALASFDAAQVAAITPLSQLSNDQLAALTSEQLAQVTAAQIDSLTPAQITALGADVAALPAAALASFDAAQVAAITPLGQLSNTQLAALTPAQLAQVTAAQIDSLTPAQITALGADVAALSAEALAGFDAAQVAAITPLSQLSDEQLAALTPAQLAQVTAAQIDSLTPAQITALGADVAALPAAALASFDAAQVAAIAPLGQLSDDQLAALTAAQLAQVTAAQINSLTPAQITALGADVTALPAAALASLDAAQVAAIAPLGQLSDEQLAALTAAQLAQVTAAQIDSLTPAQITALGADVAALPAAALASFDAAQVAAIAPLGQLSDEQLAALTAAQLAQVTAAQIDSLTPAQITALGADVAALPAAALASFDAAQVAAIAPLGQLSDDQLAALTAAQLAQVTAAQINNLTPAQITALGADVAALPAAALASFDAAQVAAIAPLGQLSDDQLAALTSEQLAQVTAAQIDSLTPAQITALGADVAALSAEALASFDAAQVAAIAPLGQLSDDQLAALTAAQLAQVTAAQIDSLTPAQITALGADVAALPAAALASFDAAQVAAIAPLSQLSDEQLAALTPAQLAQVTAAQIDSLTPAQVAALGVDLAGLNAAALGAISAEQAMAAAAAGAFDDLSSASLIHLTPIAISVLPLPLFAQLTPAQLSQWSSEQLSAITPQQKQVMTPGQITELSHEQAMLIQGSYAPAGVQAATSYHLQPMALFDNVGGYRVTEGSSITVLITRMGDLSAAGTVDILSGGSAASSDHTLSATTVSFAAGEASKSVVLNVTADGVVEGNETLLLSLANPSGSAQVGAEVTLTLVDADVLTWWVANAPSAITEGNTLRIEVMRSSALGAGSVTLELSGTVDGGDSAQSLSRVVNFADGVTSVWVEVDLINDGVSEGEETINRVVLRDPSAGVVSDNNHSIAVYDANATHWIVGGGNYSAGDSEAIFFVRRTGVANEATIDFRTVGGSAQAGLDYQAQAITLEFAAGQMTQVVRVPLLDNPSAQTNLTIRGLIADPTGVGAHSVQASNSMVNLVNDQYSVWSVLSGEVREDAGVMAFTISRSGNASQAASIDFATVGGSATAGVDYTAVHQTLSFAAGEVQKTVYVNIHADAISEPNETIVGVIANASSGSVATATATGTIVDHSASVWSVSGSNVTEGDQVFMLFTVSRTGAVDAAQIDFATVGGTATGGVDYTPVSQTLSFAQGQTSQVVRVPIANDGRAENNETVVAAIANPSTGVIQTVSASAQINDSSNMIWSLQTVPNSGLVSSGLMAFTITRDSNGNLEPADVRFFTVAGNNFTNPGEDYTPVDTVVSFAQGEYRKTVFVPINNSIEPGNTGKSVVGVLDSPTLGTLAQSAASTAITIAITNDSNPSGDVSLRTYFQITAQSGTVSEDAGAAAYTITRSGDTRGTQTVEYYVSGGTAVAGTHYTALGNGGVGSVSFAPGETTRVVMIPLLTNALSDAGTTLTLALRNASQGILRVDGNGFPQATVTLQDNDSPAISVYSVAATSNNASETTGVAAFTVTRSGNTGEAGTSHFRINGGTATAGTDYTNPGVVTLNWTAGETSKVVFIDLVSDAVAEGAETMIAQVSGNSDFSGTLAAATLTIAPDEVSNAWSYSVNTPNNSSLNQLLENAEYLLFSIQRSGDISAASTSYFRLTSGTVGVDYLAPEGADGAGVVTLNWAEGELRKTVRVKLLNDSVVELEEPITAQSAADAAFTQNLTSINATIRNDDWTFGTAGNDTISQRHDLGGARIDAGAGNDTVTIDGGMRAHSHILLGDGDDVVRTSNGNNTTAGGLIDGGSGVDTMRFISAGTAPARWHLVNVALEIKNIEIFDFNTVSNQFLDLSLQNVLEVTQGNAVAGTLRITSAGASNTLTLQALGKAQGTPAAGTLLTDVDGNTYTVAASAAGQADANDVVIGGRTYDVYQYNYAGNDLTLLVDVAMTMLVI